MVATFDRWNRYLIIPEGQSKAVPHTRATTLASTIDDGYGLSRWRQRMTALGLSRRPDLLARVAAARDDERATLDQVCETALEVAGSSSAANLGQALHQFTARIDLGEDVSVLEPWRRDVDAYKAATADFKFVLVEQLVVVPELVVAGTVDGVVEIDGHLYVMDKKTGSVEYGLAEWAIQLAVYANAQTTYDAETDEHGVYPEVDRETGLIVHLPVGQGRCEIIPIDLELGWQGAKLAKAVRDFRRADFHREWERDSLAESRSWVVRRVRRLVSEYPDAALSLATRWPDGVPTLQHEGHTVDQLASILTAVQAVERAHTVPFFDEDTPSSLGLGNGRETKANANGNGKENDK